MQVSLIGIDLAKRYFQVCALNRQNRVLFNRQVTRTKLPETIQQIAPTTVAMESCATANYWGRKFTEMGHEVQLVPPQHVKAFLRTHKSDARDALPFVRRRDDQICILFRKRPKHSKTFKYSCDIATNSSPIAPGV